MARRLTRFVRPPARTKVWFGFNFATEDVLTASAITFLGSFNAAAEALRPFTILRTRLELNFASDQTGASETPFGVFGMIIVTDKAVAVGVTGIPAPATNTNNDWFVYQPMQHRFLFVSGVGTQDTGTRYVVDSKAMRKVGDADDVAVMFEMDAAVGGTLVTGGRMLVQLH